LYKKKKFDKIEKSLVFLVKKMESKNNNIITLGCRLNDAESEIISNLIGKNEIIVINTCSVTENAKKESISKIREIITNNKNSSNQKKIYVTGCAVQLNPDLFLKIDGVDRVIGNMDKLEKSSYNIDSSEQKIWREMFGKTEKLSFSEIKDEEELIRKRNINKKIKDDIKKTNFIIPNITKLDGKTRGLIQIQNGCNHDCTFCVIYIARGKNRSIRPYEVLNQIKILIENGYKEIVLTGVDITDYGRDFDDIQMNLAKLLKKIINAFSNKLFRIRLSSIDVSEIDNELFDILANEKKILPYFHLSMQSGSDLILKRMKRRHSAQNIRDFCINMLERRNDAVFGADIIAGFPTETEELFLQTKNLVEDIERFIHLHVFPFSAHSETPSSKMPQIDKKTIKERAKILREIGLNNRLKFFQNILKNQDLLKQKVLFENNYSGYTDQYLKFYLKQEGHELADISKTDSDQNSYNKIKNNTSLSELKGEIIDVKILGIEYNIKKTLWPFYFIGEI
jgi:threonylcarbamoyladenosine tRNA methylthiotransferase MtaB